jgi:hypothetical protein
MTTDEFNNEKPQSITDAHPTLGKYLSHHPSNRIRLIIQAAIFYAIPVAILQALFWNVDNNFVTLFLPMVFAAVGLVAFWYAAHFWNREVIVYENGFTYQQGSQVGQFRYADIVMLKPDVQRINVLRFIQRTDFNYTLITVDDEVLRITNLYSDINKLVARLEASITRDRLPIMQQAIQAGQTVDVGGGLRLSKMGLEYEGRELFWHELGTRNVREGNLILRKQDNSEWAAIPIAELNNPVLLLAVLKQNAALTPQA